MLMECETKFFSCKFSFDLSVARMQKISRKGLEKGGLKKNHKIPASSSTMSLDRPKKEFYFLYSCSMRVLYFSQKNVT